MNTAREDPSCVVPFQFESKDIRIIQKPGGEICFIAKEVCDVLELTGDPGQHTRRLDEDQKGLISIQTLGGMQEVQVINESGFYDLVLRSKKPQAKPFRKWVTSEVLPAIRKTGCYSVPGVQVREDLSGVLKALQDHVMEWMSRRPEPFTLDEMRKEIPLSLGYARRLMDKMSFHRLVARVGKNPSMYRLSDRAKELFGLAAPKELPHTSPSVDTITITRKEWNDLSKRIHTMAERLRNLPSSPPPLAPLSGHWRLKEEAAVNYPHLRDQFDRTSNRMLHFFPAEALAEALDVPYSSLMEFLSREHFEIVSEYDLTPHPPRPEYIQKHQPIMFVTSFGLWKIMGAGRRAASAAAATTAVVGKIGAERERAREAPKDEEGVPVTDIGVFNLRPWEMAKRMYPELYAALEAKYAELGKEKHRGWESMKDSVFWLTEQLAVHEEYRQAMMPKYLEAVLKLQLMALGHASVLEEMDKLYDLKKLPKIKA